MLIYTLYKSPLWNKLPAKNRIIKIFGIGILLYFIIQSLIYSKYFNNNALTNYGKYIYYIIILDIITTITTMTISFNTENKYIDYNPRYQQNIPYGRLAEQADIPYGRLVEQANIPLALGRGFEKADIPDARISQYHLVNNTHSINSVANNQIEWQSMDQYDNIKLNDIKTNQGKLQSITYNNSTNNSQLLSKIKQNIDEQSYDIPVYKSDKIKKKSNIDDVSYDIPSYKPNK